MSRSLILVSFTAVLLVSVPAFAQYSPNAGVSAPGAEEVRELEEKERELKKDRSKADKKGKKKKVKKKPKRTKRTGNTVSLDPMTSTQQSPVPRDKFGNAGGAEYDLAVDGAFEGQTIVVVQLHQFSFENAKQALAAKGFGVVRYTSTPSPKELRKSLKKANQFWLISSCYGSGNLTEEHTDIISEFFQEGHGVYIWGDNDPCYEEANFVSRRVLDIEMEGDTYGDKVVSFRTNRTKSGLLRDHLLSTGIENLYEGITIATIQMNDSFTPFLWGSAGNIVAAFFDHEGKRAIIDGGFTRLYGKWDTAGTGRYVANAAAWLANYERFGEKIVAKKK